MLSRLVGVGVGVRVGEGVGVGVATAVIVNGKEAVTVEHPEVTLTPEQEAKKEQAMEEEIAEVLEDIEKKI